MSKYAIIETGGKQYRVEEGEPILIERVRGVQPGERVAFERVLLLAQDGQVKIGRPYLKGAKVVGTLLEERKGEKIRIFKYKPKKRQSLRRGHRQIYARALIEEIQG